MVTYREMLDKPEFSDSCKESIREMGRMYRQFVNAVYALESDDAEEFIMDFSEFLARKSLEANHRLRAR
jgi:hypothetical protein